MTWGWGGVGAEAHGKSTPFSVFFSFGYLIVWCCLLWLVFLWSAQWYRLKNKKNSTIQKSEKGSIVDSTQSRNAVCWATPAGESSP